MDCKNHPGTQAVTRCYGCEEAFCPDCLVEIQGQHYCEARKMTVVSDSAPAIAEDAKIPCKEANDALIHALVGIFCCGFVLAPVAIIKALKAHRMIEEDPRLTGSGKVTAALIISSIVFILWLAGVVIRLRLAR